MLRGTTPCTLSDSSITAAITMYREVQTDYEMDVWDISHSMFYILDFDNLITFNKGLL
jgi:hypothetical protein